MTPSKPRSAESKQSLSFFISLKDQMHEVNSSNTTQATTVILPNINFSIEEENVVIARGLKGAQRKNIMLWQRLTFSLVGKIRGR